MASAHSASLRSNINEYLLSCIIHIWYLTVVFPSWRTGTAPPVQPNELIPPITIEILPSATDGNSNSIRVEELSETVWPRTTTLLLVGFTEESVVSFTNGMNVDGTVILISLSLQLKIHTYI